MKVKESLRDTFETLAAGAVEEAYLESELLLMHVLGVGRAGLYVALEEEMPPQRARALAALVDRRLTREPLAYITGRREFFELDFHVSHGVLIPRPETELLVEEVAAFVRGNYPCCDPVIVDVGTGCGAIAVSLAKMFPYAKVVATDISPRALEVARINCQRNNVNVDLLHGDLLESVSGRADVIVANLPYVRDDEMECLCDEIRLHEPAVALAGGGDGLDIIRRLIVDAPGKLREGAMLLLEIAPEQAEAVASLAAGCGSWGGIDLVGDCGGVIRAAKLILTKRLVEV